MCCDFKPFNRRCRPYSFFTFFIAHHISAFKPVKDKKSDINRRDLKYVDRHFVKSE